MCSNYILTDPINQFTQHLVVSDVPRPFNCQILEVYTKFSYKKDF